jgi:ankyrin repeat protein
MQDGTLDGNVTALLCAAAHYGDVREVRRLLAEMGANVNAYNENGCTPVYAAAQKGHTATVRALAELGANVNAPNIHGFTPVHRGSKAGHLSTVRALVEFGANIDTPAKDGTTPIYVAAQSEHVDVVLYIVSIGVNVTQLFDTSLNPPTSVSGMMTRLCEALKVKADTGVYGLFAMTKLMSNMMNDDDAAAPDDREVFEIAIARGFSQSIATSTVPKRRKLCRPYPLRRKLCRLAYRVYLETLLFDGERISLSIKARRYVELVCLFLDQAMLTDVCALRMTCKSNHLIRRFPIYYSTYRELEANLIEGFVGYDACRFVSTSQMYQIIAIHNMT